MRCPNCGADIPDNTNFCGACGTVISQAANNSAAQPNPQEQQTGDTAQPENGYAQPNMNGGQTMGGNFYQQPEAPSASKKGLIILGAVAVAIVVVIVLLFNLLFGSSYKDPIKDFTRIMNKRSLDAKDLLHYAYGEALGDFYYESAKRMAKLEDEDDWEDDLTEMLEEGFDDLDDEYGDDWKIKIDIKKATKLRDSKLDDYQEEWEERIDSLDYMIDLVENNDDYDEKDVKKLVKFYEKELDKLSDMKVKAGYTLKIRMTIKGEDDKESETTEMTVLKIGGDWVVWDSGDLDLF